MDRYLWWRNALAGNFGPIHEDEPQAGFFRRKIGDDYKGIAIWYDGDKPLALVNGKSANPHEAWISGAKRPVSESAYRTWESSGIWPDDHKIIAPAAHGSNEPADEAEMLRDQIESAKAGAADYKEVTSDEQAAKAQSLRSRLLELGRDADRKRETLKKPHLEAGKAIDATWQPLIKAAKEVADTIARAMGAWETKKANEARRKADEERRRFLEDVRVAEATSRTPPPPPESAAAPAPTTQIRGGYGRAAAVKVVRVVSGIADWNALLAHYRTDERFLALVLDLAHKDVGKGFDVPGVTIEEQRKVA